MITRFVFGLAALLAGLAWASEPGLRQTTTGFYPIWENSGYTARNGEVYLGSNAAQVGIGDVGQVGVQPIAFMYRSPNAYLKLALFQNRNFDVAFQVQGYYLLEQASRSSFSPTYVSRLDNPDYTLFLLPVAIPLTWRAAEWLDIHNSTTAFNIFSSGPVQTETYLADALTFEFLPRNRHALNFHFGEVGFWKHDLSYFGASYRYRNSWIEGQIGYFYRIRQAGNQSSPMISLGLLL